MQLGSILAPVIGSEVGAIPVHGDFVPWNSSATEAALALWDWEAVRLGAPLEDMFHWQTQRLVLFGTGNVEELVYSSVAPGPLAMRLLDAAGLDASQAPEILRSYLERSAEELATQGGRALLVRRQALDLLEAEASR
jgi:hypothetical protein